MPGNEPKSVMMSVPQALELALEHKRAGKFVEAEKVYQQILSQQPNNADALHLMGVLAFDRGNAQRAIELIQQAISIKPIAGMYYHLGNAFKDLDQIDASENAFRKAIELKPNIALAHNNLGNVLKVQGKPKEAIGAYRKALEYESDLANAHSNIICVMHLIDEFDAATILQETLKWSEKYADPFKAFIRPHLNDRNPDRKLRIGYISSDFRAHVVGWNLLPLIREHDHKKHEIYCYSGVSQPDDVTARVRFYSDRWRNIVQVSDQDTAQMIYDDQIDILIDLSVHSSSHRLGVFARKPAPVQATWLGYAGTTGLSTMDYRLSDPYLDPPGTDLSVYREQTVCLAHSFWCYQPGGETVVPGPLPAKDAGFVTFCSMNNFSKVTPAVMDLWAKILNAVPRSRLVLYSKPGSHQEQVRNRFAGAGISLERLNFVGWQPWLHYINLYNRVDIALDTFPWGGGITNCDSLYMGVPVVSLSGRTAVGRGGKSILTNIGLPELAARTQEEYLDIAVKLAGDLPRLTELRRTLRQRMQQSPLMNAKRFARDIEAAYREMWRKWCEKSQAEN
ncbi:MAG TPA: tetratricopeptide repeat protein [Phycisphaerae bacterium]|nr:tetratricopeptide repeat protein [Phycisphaerae bacterium]